MSGTKEGLKADIELPDIAVLRQLCRAELAARLDSVSVIIYVYFRHFVVMTDLFIFVSKVPRPLFLWIEFSSLIKKVDDSHSRCTHCTTTELWYKEPLYPIFLFCASASSLTVSRGLL